MYQKVDCSSMPITTDSDHRCDDWHTLFLYNLIYTLLVSFLMNISPKKVLATAHEEIWIYQLPSHPTSNTPQAPLFFRLWFYEGFEIISISQWITFYLSQLKQGTYDIASVECP